MQKCANINIRLEGLPPDFSKERVLMLPIMLCISSTSIKKADISISEEPKPLGMKDEPPASKKPRCDPPVGPVLVVDLSDSLRDAAAGDDSLNQPPQPPPGPQLLPDPPRHTVFEKGFSTMGCVASTIEEHDGASLSQPLFDGRRSRNRSSTGRRSPKRTSARRRTRATQRPQ